jgi:putative flippase GtrA
MSALWRYALVGAVATAAHWLVLAALVEGIGLVPWLASGVGAAVGAQVAYVGNRRYTFGQAAGGWRAWARFMATAAVGAAVGMGGVAAGVAAGLHYLASQALATGGVLLLTFAINRAWSFRTMA